MGILKIAALFFLLQAGTSALQQQPAQEKASIEGVVLRAVSGEPLSSAEVRLIRVRSEAEMREVYSQGNFDPDSEFPPVLTESDGKFTFKDIDSGQYRLAAVRNGYPRQMYGQKVAEGPGTIVNLRPGQAVKDLTFRLVQGGVVTGRVRDTAGQPLTGLTVHLMRSNYDGSGKKVLYPAASEQTDDRGEYRFFWIESGRYYLMANRGDNYRPQNMVVDRRLPNVFYPGVVEPESASTVEVQPGQELSAIDIVIPNISGYRITGRLVEASTGKPPKSASVQIAPKKQGAITFYDNRGPSGQYNSTTGTFEIRNVLPGTYWLTAQTQTNYNDPLPADRLAEVKTQEDLFRVVLNNPGAGAQITIEVAGSDLRDLVVTLNKGISIPVHLSVEAQDLASIKGLDSIRVSLQSETGGGQWREGSRLNSDGTARVDGVLPAEYNVNVDFGTAKDLFVKEVLYGREDALYDPVRISDQAPSTLTILLSTKGGQVEGVLTDALSQPVAGVEVLLIPDNRDLRRPMGSVNTDPDGRFVFRNRAPGGYRLFSWEALEPGAYFDNDVLSRYETQGKPVRIQESSKETVNLTIIPAPKP